MENLNKSFEPMDVDLSSQSTSAMDISYNNSASEIHSTERDELCTKSPTVPTKKTSPKQASNYIAKRRAKRYHINLQNKFRTSRDARRLQILIFIFVLFVSIILCQTVFFCYKEPNLQHLKETLTTQIFGQEEGIESIIDALAAEDALKVLFLYGGTGVGKTLTSTLIMDNLGASSNLYHYTMPTFADTFSSNLMVGLSICESTTIILDDLSIDNNVSEQINQVIAKSDYLKRNLTIILIHNCGKDSLYHKKCDESVQSILLEKYKNPLTSYFFIKYKTLTDFHLRKCIDKSLGDTKIDNLTYEKIVKKFNVTSDGCKGVHTKVKSLNII